MLMAHSSLQVCMDSSDWLQGTMSEELSGGLDSSSSPSGGTTTECMLAAACSSRAGPPLMERRLRPPHDQNLKCPRCDSTHTKFCYYNNYSLSQPRYFCKTCRRYWTKGGTLRNIPVGGGCRKNKKSSSKNKSNNNNNDPQIQHQGPLTAAHLGSSPSPNNNNHHSPIDLHLSFPAHEVQFPSHLANLISAQMSLGGAGGGGGGGGGFMEGGGLLRPIDFMESKYEGLVGGGNRGHDFMGGTNNINGNDQFGLMGGIGGYNTSFASLYSSNAPFGMSTTTTTTSNDMHHHDGSSGISFMDQRLLLPYDGNNNGHHHHNNHQSGVVDVKPNPKLLSLEWHDQGCTPTTSDHHHHNAAKDSSFGYNVNGSNGLGSWTGMVGGFQSPTTNSLV